MRQPHRQPVMGPQGDPLHGSHFVSLDEIEPDRPHDGGEHDHGLLKREARADADPGTGPERQIGEAVDPAALLGQEALGPEDVRLIPQPALAVTDTGYRPSGVASEGVA